MPPFKKHIFICMNARPAGHPKGSCQENGSQEVLERLMVERENRNLMADIKVSRSSCLGPCNSGPVAVVYPDNVWYRNLTADAMSEIVEEHLINDNPVEKYRIPEEAW